MKTTGLGILLLVAFAVSGCGNDSDNNGYMYQQGLGLGGPAPVQGYCAPEVINAYNNFQSQCDLSRYGNNMNFQPCRFSAEHFLRLYPGISCIAAPYGNQFGPGYDNNYFRQHQGQQVFLITDYPMRSMLQFLEQTGRGGGNNNGWRNYQRWPQVGNRR